MTTRVCVIRHAHEDTPRLAREITALNRAGYEIDVICLGRDGQARREHCGGVTYHRLFLRRYQGRNPIRYVGQYLTFFLASAGKATALHLRRRFDVVQVNSLPDALVFAAAIPHLLGARVLLDLQEPMPEFFMTKFRVGLRHPVVRIIARLEQASIRFADAVITPTAPLRTAFIARGADGEKLRVVMDGADEEVFRPIPMQREPGSRRHYILISHGTVEEHYGLDTAIQAVALLRAEIPELRLQIIGEGPQTERLRALAEELDVSDIVSVTGVFIPLDELVRRLADADLGIVAMKKDRFRDLVLTNKMFDFIAMRKPMVVSRTNPVEEAFDSSTLELFVSGDPQDLARAIRVVYSSPDRGAAMARRAAEQAERYRWPHQRRVYLDVVEALVGRGDLPPMGQPSPPGAGPATSAPASTAAAADVARLAH